MHKRRSDFDPLKFTPKRIANKIELSILEVNEYFQTHSLKECADKFGCSAVTIKRRLRSAGFDTSIHNHSKLALDRYIKSTKEKPSDEVLKQLYIDENLDTKTIAEMFGLHFTTIRNAIRRLNLVKTAAAVSDSMMRRHLLRYGVRHPSQRPDVIKKTSVSLNKAIYKNISFKSLTELGFALYLDKSKIEWYYEEMLIPYVDMLTGIRRIYVVDFTLVENDKITWVEIKPDNKMIPDDKMIYASRRAEEAGVIYRGLFDEERSALWQTIYDGYNFEEVEFQYRTPRSGSKKITYYFKSELEAIDFKLNGWREFTKPTNRGALWKKIMIRE